MQLPYGRGSVAIPDRISRRAEILRHRRSRPLSVLALRKAVRAVANWAAKGERILVVVPDATRYAAAPRVLAALRVALDIAGADDFRIRLLFANGLHRPPDREEQRAIVGPEIADAWRTHVHDPARDCVSLGTMAGIPVEVSRHVVESDRVVLLGSAGYHYLAGFSGGWKLLFPGCASEATIVGLHRKTLDRGCGPGRVDKNPFREAIDGAGRLLPALTRSIHTVLGPENRLLAVDTGEPDKSLDRAARKIRNLFRVRAKRPVDVVIASAGGHPKDITLIQSHKAMEHASRILKPGGRMLLLAECESGSGHPDFGRWFEKKNPAELLSSLRKNFHPYGRTAWSLWTKTTQFEISMVSRLDTGLLRKARLTPTDVDGFTAGIEDSESVAVLPEAGFVLPEATSTTRSIRRP